MLALAEIITEFPLPSNLPELDILLTQLRLIESGATVAYEALPEKKNN